MYKTLRLVASFSTRKNTRLENTGRKSTTIHSWPTFTRGCVYARVHVLLKKNNETVVVVNALSARVTEGVPITNTLSL